MALLIRSNAVVFFFLILSVIVSALPAHADMHQLATRGSNRDLIQQISTLQTDIELVAGTIAEVTVVTDLTFFIESLVTKVNRCDLISQEIGGKVDIDPSTKADVAFKITAIIVVLSDLRVELTTRFGVRLARDPLTEINACRSTLLSGLSIWTSGALAPSSQILDSAALAQAHLRLSVNALDSISV